MVIGRKTLVVRKAGGTLGLALSLRRGAHGLLRGRSDRSRFGSATAAAGYFPPALRTFASRAEIARLRRPTLRCGRSVLRTAGAGPPRPRPSSPARADWTRAGEGKRV